MNVSLTYDKPYEASILSEVITSQSDSIGNDSLMLISIAFFVFIIIMAFAKQSFELIPLSLVFLSPALIILLLLPSKQFEARVSDVESVISVLEDEDYKRVVFVKSNSSVENYVDRYLYLDERSLSTRNYENLIDSETKDSNNSSAENKSNNSSAENNSSNSSTENNNNNSLTENNSNDVKKNNSSGIKLEKENSEDFKEDEVYKVADGVEKGLILVETTGAAKVFIVHNDYLVVGKDYLVSEVHEDYIILQVKK